MGVQIASKTDYTGSVTPSALNTETDVVSISAQTDDYIVEGYIDLSAMQDGDTIVVTEYISVDGQNYRVFLQATFNGAQAQPILRFHSKMLYKNMLYKVTINQTAGTVRTIPYAFILQVLKTTT